MCVLIEGMRGGGNIHHFLEFNVMTNLRTTVDTTKIKWYPICLLVIQARSHSLSWRNFRNRFHSFSFSEIILFRCNQFSKQFDILKVFSVPHLTIFDRSHYLFGSMAFLTALRLALISSPTIIILDSCIDSVMRPRPLRFQKQMRHLLRRRQLLFYL